MLQRPQEYALRHLTEAVQKLKKPGSPRQHLFEAFVYHLDIFDVELLPSAVRDDFRRLQSDTSRVSPTGDEGAVEATVAAMTDEEVVEMTSRVISLHRKVASLAKMLD